MPGMTLHSARRFVITALLLGAPAERCVAQVTQEVGYRSLVGVVTSSTTGTVDRPPANLLVPSPYDDLVSRMWQRSPAFRRQARRIAEEPALVVRVQITPLKPGARATTRVTREAGSIEALINIRDAAAFVELLAHELEHILEQLDGLDLAAAARRARNAVWVGGDGAFETVRAIHVGEQVAAEVLRFEP